MPPTDLLKIEVDIHELAYLDEVAFRLVDYLWRRSVSLAQSQQTLLRAMTVHALLVQADKQPDVREGDELVLRLTYENGKEYFWFENKRTGTRYAKANLQIEIHTSQSPTETKEIN